MTVVQNGSTPIPVARWSMAGSLADIAATCRLVVLCDEFAAGRLVVELRRRLPNRRAALVGIGGPLANRVELDLMVALMRAGYAVVAASQGPSLAHQARHLAGLLFAEDATVVALPTIADRIDRG